MSRDQRLADNWALLHAIEAAQGAAGSSQVAVAFNLVRVAARVFLCSRAPCAVACVGVGGVGWGGVGGSPGQTSSELSMSVCLCVQAYTHPTA